MQDRISLYPGRVTLTPVAGQENVYDLVRADQPTQEGTHLNKANLLTDATAALYGLGSSAVPNEVLAKIKTLVDAANANADGRARIVTGSYVGTGGMGSSNPCSLTFDEYPTLLFVTTSSGDLSFLLISYPNTTGIVAGYTGTSVTVRWSTQTPGQVRWYHSSNSNYQFNASSKTYYYYALFV